MLLLKPMKPNTPTVLVQIINFVLRVSTCLHSTVLLKLPNEILHSLEYSTIHTLTDETAASKSGTTFKDQTQL